MAVLGMNEPNPLPRLPPLQARNNGSAIAPWNVDPRGQFAGARPFGQSQLNDSAEHLKHSAPSLLPRPSSGKTDFPDYGDFDTRRPSIASATTVSSSGSKSSGTGARFQKTLKSFFGEDPTEPRKGSQASLAEQDRNGRDGASGPTKVRNDSLKSQNATPDLPRPQTPVPSSAVTPWSYQEFSVSVKETLPNVRALTCDRMSPGSATPRSGMSRWTAARRRMVHTPRRPRRSATAPYSIGIPGAKRKHPSHSRLRLPPILKDQ